MNNLKYTISENHKMKEACLCGEDMNNTHLFECQFLNKSEKTIPYNNIFSGRLSELKYWIDILKENEIKLENYTQAQDITLLSRQFVNSSQENIYIYNGIFYNFSKNITYVNQVG